MDTIFAEASAPGRAGVSIIRISGPAAFAAGRALAGDLPEPGRHVLRRIRNDAGDIVDQGLVLTFAAPASFTGEDVVELQLHGSRAVVKAILDALTRQYGLRLAEPGEFTRRALLNDRMDLAQVEGLADLIDAETEAQRRQAQRVFDGALGSLVEALRSKLLRAAALVEATIDFADEEVPEDVTDEVVALITSVRADLSAEMKGAATAERLRDGFEVAILGAPNAGKSTLLNALAGRDAAITSDVAGTTRDVIEVRMDLGGLPVTLLDTAGLRDTVDTVEVIGVDLARKRAAAADLRVWLLSQENEEPGIALDPDDIVIRSKTDLTGGEGISAKTGAGLDRLVGRIAEVLGRRAAEVRTATRARHLAAMDRAALALDAATAEIAAGPDRADIAAEEIRNAIRALEALVGRIDVEDVLGEIFSSFCIGK
ncbi:tRNA uridine-5-carboxymethylaminomethyl(34) synthesis GTPase MnmE [Rhodobacterales bacterium HKCCE3408]|nr:tRNA uridine-5-carboxymethylaminomethyl(34) synthesis GTPase MnmE [Rhodobacterales bacterium HKCCE3408]